jgi:RimJ/RimL family protein N-acetyltransferase
MKLPIFTERLMLRKLTQKDIDNIFLLDSNPEVMKYVGVPPVTTNKNPQK